MEKANYIKKDIWLILVICIFLGLALGGLFFYDLQTNNLTNLSGNLYNWLLKK